MLLFSTSCRTTTQPDTAQACTADPPLNGRHVFEGDAGVGKIGSGGCDGVGGTPVSVAGPGTLYTRTTWSDPNATLKTEIWRGLFQEVLATGLRRGSDLCVTASAPVSPGLYVVRTCHTADSAVPLSSVTDSSTFTSHHLKIIYP